ncbi:uncharacterized protein LOC115887043 [Sitophilus oryzae]|uniref:Uncharacterized protein LOC115887043 n=1 Tax=Sitophilus oryzae TaxID=7048 RepID=A0A6J2YFY0_SITOR|nr:uncharacterized protein LOC115887043 [Sitophilus oryzae]
MQCQYHQVSKLLSELLDTEHARRIYKDYPIREGQVYRTKAKILQWIVIMPTFYKRKGTVNRATWSAEALQNAMNAVSTGTLGVNQAPREYGIPKTTLKNRIKLQKSRSLGKQSCLNEEAELKLVSHIKKMQKYGFTPNRDLGLNKTVVEEYFSVLENVLTEYQLFEKPGNIFNIDESGLQLNNKPGYVIAEKGSKTVSNITSGEKGETISIVACCSAEGVFLPPPLCILKGKNLKECHKDGMPPGSAIVMNEKSAYINAVIRNKKWLEEHFLPRKPAGTALIILDGHTSHTNSVEVLEFCEANEIILLCLPSHTTHFLQPLDRSFFKSLKSHYYSECNRFMKTNPSRKITRYQFGKLLGEAWNKSATVQNAISGFKATGILPFNPSIIPDYAYLSDTLVSNSANQTDGIPNRHAISLTSNPNIAPTLSPVAGCSKDPDYNGLNPPNCPNEQQAQTTAITPGKALNEIAPVINTSAVNTVRKRARQVANVLTSPENIELQKQKKQKAEIKNKSSKERAKKKRTITKRLKEDYSDDSNSESEIILQDSESGDEEWDENDCAGCGENYSVTRKKDDWFQCTRCDRWSHEGCMKYSQMCDRCGKTASKNSA